MDALRLLFGLTGQGIDGRALTPALDRLCARHGIALRHRLCAQVRALVPVLGGEAAVQAAIKREVGRC